MIYHLNIKVPLIECFLFQFSKRPKVLKSQPEQNFEVWELDSSSSWNKVNWLFVRNFNFHIKRKSSDNFLRFHNPKETYINLIQILLGKCQSWTINIKFSGCWIMHLWSVKCVMMMQYLLRNEKYLVNYFIY